MNENTIRVGSAVIIENNKGEILLAKSNKEPVKGYWVIPGGGIKFGEKIRDAVIREIKEEIGLDIKLTNFVTTYELIVPGKEHRIIFYHKGKVKHGEPKFSDDVSRVIWIKPNDIKKLNKVAYTVIDVLKIASYLKKEED